MITKIFPCRLITRDPGLFFSDLTELRTFMAASSWLEPEACRALEHDCGAWYSLLRARGAARGEARDGPACGLRR